MMKKYFMALALAPALYFSQIPAGYYDSTAGLTGYALKNQLHQIISPNYNWNYGDLNEYYKQTDLDVYYDHTPANNPTGGVYVLLDIYSEIPGGPDAYEYNTTQMVGSSGQEGLGYNREHVVPQNTFDSFYPMYSDLHYVIPTDARINQLRSNYPYGIVGATVFYTFSNTSKIGNDLTPGFAYTGRVYEPIDEFKGDIARSIFYFITRYQSQLPYFKHEQYATSSTQQIPANDRSPLDGTAERALDPAYINMLKLWHISDPVSQREIDRNNAVYNIQKNRNPFIDNPALVDLVWSETPDAVAPAAPSNLSVSQQNAHFVNLSWTPSSDTDVLGYRIYMSGLTEPVAFTKNTNISIDRLTPNTSYTFTVKSFDKGYLESPQSNAVTATTIASDSFAKDLMITKYIEGTGNNRAIEITNKTGHTVDLNNYHIVTQQYNNTYDNYYFTGHFQLEGTIANNESKTVLNPNAVLSCMTNQQADFVTAAPALSFTGSEYVELAYRGNFTVDAVGTKSVMNTNADMSLYRLSSVAHPTDVFSMSEWQMYPSDYCQNLGTLSVQDQVFAANEMQIYPNPVHDVLYLNGKDISKIQNVEIYDMSGRKVMNSVSPFKNSNGIYVEHLKPGVYILKADVKTFRFIKK